MDSKSIRANFLQFFKDKGHKIVPSAPIVVQNDPTLMFTNAGMNQFKDYFLGHAKTSDRRVADTQKCMRVSGKHNDLEDVGMDTYHHTMFEMLGNWSFGDYFKKDAINWAWELLTEVYKLPKDRMYATVFGGDSKENLEVDSEAYSYWKEIIGEDRVLYGNKKDNFWEMGETGPCGPCSELHIDLRPEEERTKVDGKSLVNADHPQVVELWNLVFIQYNRLVSSELQNLPEKHVDTGMGFERLCMAIQGKLSNYDTDVFQPLMQAVARKANVDYGDNEKNDIAIRVIADHIRAIAFTIADGQLPSNTGAGYVVRRILRRAVRYGYTFLGFREPFMQSFLPILIEQFDRVFPQLKEQKDFLSKVITEEENTFLRTLETGLKRLEHIIEQEKSKGSSDEKSAKQGVISGKQSFELYDTFGFPLDLTALIARENGIEIDIAGFEHEMLQQKNRSKADAEKQMGDWNEVLGSDHSEFVGYENLVSEVKIVKYRKIIEKKKEKYQLVFDKTPFYAEGGGQVGDTGYLEANDLKIKILDTKKENDLIVHFVDKLPDDFQLSYGAVVDDEKRNLTMNNHSATHLMHTALRKVLGTHVEQRGSLVNDKGLRFDFSHFSKMTDEEIRTVEKIVNEKIRENIPLEEYKNVPIEEAKNMGAMALFGEKYGDNVRVIAFDKEYSVELCGGTHTSASGNIGLFKITSESSIAAGVRRIEAITGSNAEQYYNEHLDKLAAINTLLKDPNDTKIAIASLIEERNRLQKELEKVHIERTQQLKQKLIGEVVAENGINTIIEKVTLPNSEALKTISFELKKQVSDLFMVLAGDIGGKPQIAVVISENIVTSKGLNAGQIVRELAKEIKGGGGGHPFFATAGGKDISGLDNVIKKAQEIRKRIFR